MAVHAGALWFRPVATVHGNALSSPLLKFFFGPHLRTAIVTRRSIGTIIMSNVAPQQSNLKKDGHPPNLTPYIVKINDQYLAGGGFGDVYRCRYRVGGSAPQEV